MLQLGLSRVVTWLGSRFKKQRIMAQNLIVPTPLRDDLQSYAQLIRLMHSGSKRPLDLHLLIMMMVHKQRELLRWQSLLPFGSHNIVLFRNLLTSLFSSFDIPNFCLNCPFLSLQSAGCLDFCLSLLFDF